MFVGYSVVRLRSYYSSTLYKSVCVCMCVCVCVCVCARVYECMCARARE